MRWIIEPGITDAVRKQLADFSDLEAQLLFNRGIFSNEAAEVFWHPERGKLLDPELLPNVKTAAEAILGAVKHKEQIFIYGDYDVDGVSSTSILFDFLFRTLGAKVLPYIPNRFEEGYGLGKTGLDAILKQEGKLVITADCGIRDANLVSEYSKKGLRFIVTDHHTIPTDETGEFVWPEKAVAVVHPGLDKAYPFPQICATTVVWKLVKVLARMAFAQGMLKKQPDTDKYLDLVALATICDIMPIHDENRILVKEGLDIIRKNRGNSGLAEIIAKAEIAPADFDTYHFGFVIGPRLNAAGRIKHALDGVRLLTSKDKSSINRVALELEKLNLERQKLTQIMLEQALVLAQEQVDRGEQLILVHGEDWSEGVVGLVASKLNERYYKPVLVANYNKKAGIIKGSARSIAGFDIIGAISLNHELLTKFGGHNQAAGFTLPVANLEAFTAALQSFARANISAELAESKLKLEANLKHRDLNLETVTMINRLSPFGYGNKEPLFLIENLQLWGAPKLLGKEAKHLKITLASETKDIIEVIGFNLAEKLDIIRGNQLFDVAGTLSINSWNGRDSLQIKMKDIRPHQA